MRYAEIISEKVNLAYLYHGTDCDNAARIIHGNRLSAFSQHRSSQMSLPPGHRVADDYGNVAGVCLTRSKHFAHEWTSNFGVVFVLDQAKLRANHLIRPFLYYRDVNRAAGRREAEEFVIGPKGIVPLDKYLIAIEISRRAYEECITDNADYLDPEDARYTYLVNHPLLKVI